MFVDIKRFRAALRLLIVMAFLAVALNQGVWASERPTLKVVIDNNYPPYSFLDNNGNPQGITIDQWKLFEKKTGIHVEISAVDWKTALAQMENGEADVIDTIFFNEERAKLYVFSKPYAKIEVPIFFDKNISGITDVHSLKGFSVAAKEGDTAVSQLMRAGITDIKLYNSYEDIIQGAKDREVTIFVVDKPPALYYMYKMQIQNRFNYAESLYSGEFHRAVHKEDVKLLATLEDGFSMISVAEYKAINDKWFGISPVSARLLRGMAYSISAVCLIGFVLIMWNFILRRTVRRKTMELTHSLEDLKRSDEQVKGILEATPDMFFLLDNDGVFCDFHGVAGQETYVPRESFIGKRFREIFPPDLATQFEKAVEQLLATDELQLVEYRLDPPGSYAYFEARLVRCSQDQIVGIVRDITESKEAEEHMRRMSIYDSLTDLYNRHYFESEMIRLQQLKPESMGLIMCDLDGLKLVNDTLGHSTGDYYLKIVADALKSTFYPQGIVSRIGGDEFTVLIPNIEKRKFEEICNDFRNRLANHLEANNAIPVSVSLGTAYSEDSQLQLAVMLKEADVRMYREKLHRKQSVRHDIVLTLKKMLEVRDFITEGHAARMEDLAVQLARVVGVAERDIPDIRLFAQFHDIGKVGIPDHILFKPASLSDNEYEVMKRHTEIGYHIALTASDLVPIADWILKHHEFWNGKGYPLGLEGKDIPVACRVLSIVDAYDAMTNDRPYRKGMSPEEALIELRRCSGIQFDPEFTTSFIKLLKTDESHNL